MSDPGRLYACCSVHLALTHEAVDAQQSISAFASPFNGIKIPQRARKSESFLLHTYIPSSTKIVQWQGKKLYSFKALGTERNGMKISGNCKK